MLFENKESLLNNGKKSLENEKILIMNRQKPFISGNKSFENKKNLFDNRQKPFISGNKSFENKRCLLDNDSFEGRGNSLKSQMLAGFILPFYKAFMIIALILFCHFSQVFANSSDLLIKLDPIHDSELSLYPVQNSPLSIYPVENTGDSPINPQDLVQISLNAGKIINYRQCIVDYDGRLMAIPDNYDDFPYIIDLKVAGLSTAMVQKILKARLAQFWIGSLEVFVHVIDPAGITVNVVGNVVNPGPVILKGDADILAAIRAAGGLKVLDYLVPARLERKGAPPRTIDLEKLMLMGDVGENYLLKNGDTIFLEQNIKNRVLVMGEVNSPGIYPFSRNDFTLLDAVKQAGNMTSRANLWRLFVYRPSEDNGKTERITVDLENLMRKGDIGQNLALKPGDIVYVPETGKPDWNKMNNILSSFKTLDDILRTWGRR